MKRAHCDYVRSLNPYDLGDVAAVERMDRSSGSMETSASAEGAEKQRASNGGRAFRLGPPPSRNGGG